VAPPKPVQPVAAKPASPPTGIKPAMFQATTPKVTELKPSESKPAAAKAPASASSGRESGAAASSKPKVFNNLTLEKAKGSVSDRLKELSGRSYDVYEDRFLAKARASIRKVLGTGKGLFFSLPEEAEDLVYNFLRDHYSDPYMDWDKSNDRKNLLTMGFDLPSIHKVIDECYKTL
jgi:hypothetical protein